MTRMGQKMRLESRKIRQRKFIKKSKYRGKKRKRSDSYSDLKITIIKYVH